MHVPDSLLVTTLFALLALTPSIAATPTPQSRSDAIDPIPTPDFSDCIFPAVIDETIERPFALTLLSDTLPLQQWPVFLHTPTSSTQSPFIDRTKQAKPLFTLTDGILNSTFGGLYSGRFVPSTTLKPLQEFIFGGQGDPSNFYAIYNCDATGTPYTELKAGRELLVEDFVGGAVIYGKDIEDVYPGKSQTIHLRISSGLVS